MRSRPLTPTVRERWSSPGTGQFFSAGLNLTSLPDSRDGMAGFVQEFEGGLRHLLTFPLPVVAAINGHAIAGGCVFAAACDLRLAAEGSDQIGLSEVDLGLPFPGLALAVMKSTISNRWLTDLVLGARLLTPSEARKVGLVHAVVPPEQLLDESDVAAYSNFSPSRSSSGCSSSSIS